MISHKLKKPGQCIHKATVDADRLWGQDFCDEIDKWVEKKNARVKYSKVIRNDRLNIFFEDPKLATEFTLRFGG